MLLAEFGRFWFRSEADCASPFFVIPEGKANVTSLMAILRCVAISEPESIFECTFVDLSERARTYLAEHLELMTKYNFGLHFK